MDAEPRGINLPEIKSALVVRLDQIGDLVLTTPLIRELRRNLPKAWITLVVRAQTYNLVEFCPYVDEVHSFNVSQLPRVGRFVNLVRAFYRSKRDYSSRNYDLAMVPRWDVDSYSATHLIYFSGARHRIAFSESVTQVKAKINRGYDGLIQHPVTTTGVKHEVQRNLDLLRFLGGTIKSDNLELWLEPADEQYAEIIYQEHAISHADFLIAFAPGSREPRRRWPVENFVALSRQLIERYRAKLVILGASQDRELGQRFVSEFGNAVVDVTDRTSLRQAAALLRQCSLYVGNDTGLMHIAAAMSIPVVEISCHPLDGRAEAAHSPLRFGPWGVPHVILQPEQATQPCVDACVCNKPHCIKSVAVQKVLLGIEELAARCNVPSIAAMKNRLNPR